MNVHVPVINTETLNCLATDQEITFRDSMREDKKRDTLQIKNKREKTFGDQIKISKYFERRAKSIEPQKQQSLRVRL